MKRLSLLLLLTLSFNLLMAQQNVIFDDYLGKKVNVTLTDGEIFSGILKEEAATLITLKTSNAEIIIDKIKISKIEIDSYSGKYLFSNSNSTRYFFSPSAFPIEKGHGYYQNVLLSSNFFNYGITSNFSMGGGLEIISLITGYPIFFLTPKFAFKLTENLYMAAGGLFALNSEFGGLSLPFVVATYGNVDANITMGLGYAHSTFGDISDGSPIFVISGFKRISNMLGLMTDNYISVGSDSDFGLIGMHGIRIMSKRNSFDIGLITITYGGDVEVAPIPFVGYQYSF